MNIDSTDEYLKNSIDAITTGENKISFSLDDFEVLENEFKDVIRDNKLKKILRDV